jgi:hypothetical protein
MEKMEGSQASSIIHEVVIIYPALRSVALFHSYSSIKLKLRFRSSGP